MKHLIRVFWVLGSLAIPVATQAQPSFGVRAGVNLATLTSNPSLFSDPAPAIGLVAGAFALLPVNDVLGFQPEALYSRQGKKIDSSDGPVRLTLDYLQFPLLARARTGMRSPLAFLAGPSLGVRTRASYDGEGVMPGFYVDPNSELRRFDLGITAGAALDLGQVVVDGRYTWGVTNIQKDSFGSNPKNRVFSLSAGVRF